MFKTYRFKGKISKEFIGIIIIFSLLFVFIILKMKNSSRVVSYVPIFEKTEFSIKNKIEFSVKKNPLQKFNKNSSIIKLHLLKKKNSQEQKFSTKRNIFTSAQINNREIKPPNKNEVEEKKPKILLEPINLKLIGIMAINEYSSLPKKELYAILSDDASSYVVKKGDVLNNKYEILDIKEESVKIKDIEFERIEILILEEKE
jgi:hypothetical protein